MKSDELRSVKRVVVRHMVLVLLTAAQLEAQVGVPRTIDEFESVAAWTSHPSDGVALDVSTGRGLAGNAMQLDFDFRGGGGYAIARRTVSIDVPENYEFTFWIRGEAPVNTLEFKLVDPSGENVWWSNQRDFEFPAAWRKVTLKRRHISFAWGPLGGGNLARVAAIEIAITASRGGKGTVWIDQLAITPLEPARPYTATPRATASSVWPGYEPSRVIDGDTTTAWRLGDLQNEAWVALDFLQSREFGGLVVHWNDGSHASEYAIEVSREGANWETVARVEHGNGGRDFHFLPETEARHLRLRLTGGPRRGRYELSEIEVKPLEWASSRNAFFETIARDAEPGTFPKYFAGVQSYWTVIGVDGDEHEALMNQEGAIEVGTRGFSVEPFLRIDGRFVTWHDVVRGQRLARGYLPIPTVHWDAVGTTLEITAADVGGAGASSVLARYRVRNVSAQTQQITLFLALRPFQVNPPWQFLNNPGGVARVRSVGYDMRGVRIESDGARRVVPLTPPSSFAAAGFQETDGDVVRAIRAGRTLPRAAVADPFGHASAVLSYALSLAPDSSRDVVVEIPFHDAPQLAPLGSHEAASAYGAQRIDESTRRWDQKLGRVAITLPNAPRIADAIRSNLAYILVNRDGPAIHPGSRSYERSWIRDGSLTSAALLRLGHADVVRQFAEWYAPFQFANGKVPCCVDARGADPVPEHDSHGQLIYLVAEYFRHTRDTAFVRRLWPNVVNAVSYIDTLRRQRMTAEYQRADKRAYYGILPQSISHEGYSAKPMHSYWDDFFALRGLKDAAELAAVLGRGEEHRRFAAMRDELRTSVLRSLDLAMADHGIDFLPGSVELGDFDATSTTVAVAPGGEASALPRAALERTFERYFQGAKRRAAPDTAWEAYTPYEWRTVGTLIRLGWKQRAHELVDMFFGDSRPAPWNHWAEVVFRDPHAPKFIGDMPHTWVGSDFIRSALDMFAYEREADSSLVIAAGVPEAWATGPGVRIRGLSTHYGLLDLDISVSAAGIARVAVGGSIRVPPGGFIVMSPVSRPIRSVNAGPLRAQRVPGGVRLRGSGEVSFRH